MASLTDEQAALYDAPMTASPALAPWRAALLLGLYALMGLVGLLSSGYRTPNFARVSLSSGVAGGVAAVVMAKGPITDVSFYVANTLSRSNVEMYIYLTFVIPVTIVGLTIGALAAVRSHYPR